MTRACSWRAARSRPSSGHVRCTKSWKAKTNAASASASAAGRTSRRAPDAVDRDLELRVVPARLEALPFRRHDRETGRPRCAARRPSTLVCGWSISNSSSASSFASPGVSTSDTRRAPTSGGRSDSSGGRGSHLVARSAALALELGAALRVDGRGCRALLPVVRRAHATAARTRASSFSRRLSTSRATSRRSASSPRRRSAAPSSALAGRAARAGRPGGFTSGASSSPLRRAAGRARASASARAASRARARATRCRRARRRDIDGAAEVGDDDLDVQLASAARSSGWRAPSPSRWTRDSAVPSFAPNSAFLAAWCSWTRRPASSSNSRCGLRGRNSGSFMPPQPSESCGSVRSGVT